MSINKEVSRILGRDIAILKCMMRGLINSRALARYIIKTYELSYSFEAVVSAVRRYNEYRLLQASDEVKNIFKGVLVSTKDNVARVVVKDNAFTDICRDFLQGKRLKVNCRIIKSKETVTLILSQKDLEDKLSLFRRTDILAVQKDLSEIRLHFGKDFTGMKGIMARIAGELALQEVNIEDLLCSIPDILIYVKEESIISAHKSLMELKK